MALPKPYRLRERKEFDRVYRRGQRCGGRSLLLRVAAQPKAVHTQTAQPKATQAKTLTLKKERPTPDSPRRLAKPIKAETRDRLPSRIAVVVSTKVHKRAVVRNRVRRQIQAALQSLLSRLKPGKLIVITVKTSAIECDYYEFLQQLEQLLIKAEALHGH